MDTQVEGLLPFKVGQLAESRSFQPGFRSAWFRCKIKEISCKKGNMEFALEFYDFPDDTRIPQEEYIKDVCPEFSMFTFTCSEAKWTRIYQVPQIGRKRATKVEKMLMVRLQYPPICNESEVAHANTISEVTVARNGVWNVGDLVDWWMDGCYWSGRVTQILGDDKVQIELPPPPIGEGSSYEALCNDLRPSLDWSPEHGWSVPTSQEGEQNYQPCARLIMPLDQGLPIGTVDVGIQNVGAAGLMLDDSFLSPISTNTLPPVDKSKQPIAKEPTRQPMSIIAIPTEEVYRPQPRADLDRRDSATGKTGLSQRIENVEEARNSSGEDQYYSNGSAKKIRTGGNMSLNSMRSDTIEAPIIDLEELVNKVKWLKGILESGVPFPNARRPPCKFVEHHGSSAPE